MKKVYDFLGGRKVLFALMLLGVITMALFFGYAKISDWTDFMKWVFGIYAAGNGTEHVANAIKSKSNKNG